MDKTKTLAEANLLNRNVTYSSTHWSIWHHAANNDSIHRVKTYCTISKNYFCETTDSSTVTKMLGI